MDATEMKQGALNSVRANYELSVSMCFPIYHFIFSQKQKKTEAELMDDSRRIQYFIYRVVSMKNSSFIYATWCKILEIFFPLSQI